MHFPYKTLSVVFKKRTSVTFTSFLPFSHPETCGGLKDAGTAIDLMKVRAHAKKLDCPIN